MYDPYSPYPTTTNFDLDALKNKENDLRGSVCVVCGDPKPSGHHYGVLSCEGCKGFFKRYTNSADKSFTCRAGTNNCVVDIKTRGKCQACRLRKCIEGGMTRGNTTVTPNRFKAPLTPMQTRNLNVPLKQPTPQPEIQSVLTMHDAEPEIQSSHESDESSAESVTSSDKDEAYFENLKSSILQSYRSGHQKLPYFHQITKKITQEGHRRRSRVLEALKQIDDSKVLKDAIGDAEIAIISTIALIHGGRDESESDGSAESECLGDIIEVLDQQLKERGFRSQLTRILDLVVDLCVEEKH